jgi:DNA ligase-1
MFCGVALSVELQKAKQYQVDKDYTGWVMSEKLDGIRAIWDTKQLKTRKGVVIHAPSWFVSILPPFALDGELWTKRQDLENVQSIVMDKTPTDRWQYINYFVFELPNAPGNLAQRYKRLERWLHVSQIAKIRLVDQIRIESKVHLENFYQNLVNNNAEGIIIKNPNLAYFTGRSENIVKRKHSSDAEGIVIAINEGQGKYTGKMGSLSIKLNNTKVFKLGTGFSDAQREAPPQLGDLVKFKYFGFTKNGIPKHASFLMIRKD